MATQALGFSLIFNLGDNTDQDKQKRWLHLFGTQTAVNNWLLFFYIWIEWVKVGISPRLLFFFSVYGPTGKISHCFIFLTVTMIGFGQSKNNKGVKYAINKENY